MGQATEPKAGLSTLACSCVTNCAQDSISARRLRQKVRAVVGALDIGSDSMGKTQFHDGVIGVGALARPCSEARPHTVDGASLARVSVVSQ